MLGFATQGHQGVSSLAGIIATSPLIQQAKPASKLLRWIGSKLGLIAPYTLIPAEVVATVCNLLDICALRLNICLFCIPGSLP